MEPPGPVAGGDVGSDGTSTRLRLASLLEVAACSGFPTQLLLAGLFELGGLRPYDALHLLNARYVFALTIADTALVVGLVAWFLSLRGERLGRVLLGNRPLLGEGLLGLLQVPVVFLLAAVVLGAVQVLWPSMHNVVRNPLERMISSPRDAWVFGMVAVLGGGVREEVQRGFILHRFRQHLGGAWVGLVVFSLAFGLGHSVQGRDVAVTTAALGAFWGLVYLRRRSIAAAVVSHSGFNAAEIFRYTLYGV